jgi:DNA repair protein RecN (Recombination protein N)
MIRELYIENLAVIQKAQICFSENLNIFTGETGAGKSVLINSINAVLGQRVKKDIIRTGCKKAVITALFSDIGSSVRTVLEGYGIETEDNELFVTREIHSDGKSIARMNGRTVTASALREAGMYLINIHGQHDNQILLSPEKHLEIIDSFGESGKLLDDYRESFRRLQLTARRLGELKKTEKSRRERLDILNERIQEIGSLDIDLESDSNIDSELELIQNSEKISESLHRAYMVLSGTLSGSAVEMIMDCENEISEISEYSKEISNLYERLSSLRIETADISHEFLKLSESIDFDRSRLEYLADRKNKLSHAVKKYNAGLEDLYKIYEDARNEVGNFSTDSAEIERLSAEKNKLLSAVTEKAKNLSLFREKTAERFIKSVTEELKFLNMPDVMLTVNHEKGKLTINGMDNMEIMISANRGEEPKPVSAIASGGELSRIMLAIKSTLAEKDEIPTLIFDEIDTGVSGRAAQKIGIKLKNIGKIRQVICVTHLSQIAVMADNHLLIEKKTEDNRTFTEVSQLDFNSRINEIARILGGENPSPLMLENAEQELKKAMEI